MSYNSSYWKGQLDYYQSKKPPAPESYYNKDFVDRMNETRASIDNLVAERDKSWSAVGQKQDEYNTFYGTMSSYKDVYNKAESEFGVTQHQDNYEKSKKALALAESTLSALPSSINSASNRVLTQQQREDRYNILADRHIAYRDNLMAQSSAYEEVWKNARSNQQAYATAEIESQWSKLKGINSAYMDALDEYNMAGQKILDARTELRDWENKYRKWQFMQYQTNFDVWYHNLNSALSRYKSALDVEMAERKARSEQNKKELAKSLVDLHFAQERYKQTSAVLNAGGTLGKLAYLLSR